MIAAIFNFLNYF